MAFERPIREIEAQLSELQALSQRTNLDISSEIDALKKRLDEAIRTTYADLTPWERVNVARHQERPVTTDYVEKICDDFFELHGDKVFGDDQAILTGFARIGDRRFLLVGNRKGRTTKERMAYNFGCAHPVGYRKAPRKMRLPGKARPPLLRPGDTPRASPR